MSPLIVSQILPSDRRYFDLAVFDEASQITPADAVPAILRAKRLVVAGDDRQLPPTAFFTSQAAEDDAEEEELAIELAATKGFESILGSLRSLLRLRMLTWHYRSRDERLIAFSNVQFYRLPLSTRNA
jgi:superfamily I DNA and/or RNA helicase